MGFIAKRLDALRREFQADHGQMARNFIKSMLLLAGAMVAALYANASAREGRVLAAGLTALFAVSIALWVGVRFVPRLAAGVDWNWLPFFTDYKVTRDGWIYIAAAIVVTSASINTGNNLLYMVLSAMLAVMILSGVLSALNFRFLRIRARFPGKCHAGQPFPMALATGTARRIFPAFSLRIGPAGDSPFTFDPYYVPMLAAGSEEARTFTATLPSRGWFDMESVQLESRYPFGFLSKGRDYPVEGGMIAFPELQPPGEFEQAIRDVLGANQRFERGSGMDLYRIRQYETSDSARHVDWKASARTAQLKTREYAAEESRKVVLAFDRFGADGPAFEKLVSRAASLAVYLAREGVEVGLKSDDWQSPMGRSEVQIEPILRYLAVVEMSPDATPPPSAGDGGFRFSLRSGSGMLEPEPVG